MCEYARRIIYRGCGQLLQLNFKAISINFDAHDKAFDSINEVLMSKGAWCTKFRPVCISVKRRINLQTALTVSLITVYKSTDFAPTAYFNSVTEASNLRKSGKTTAF